MTGTIFEAVMNADPSIEFLVKASYIEIYMEKIKDLLDGTALPLSLSLSSLPLFASLLSQILLLRSCRVLFLPFAF